MIIQHDLDKVCDAFSFDAILNGCLHQLRLSLYVLSQPSYWCGTKQETLPGLSKSRVSMQDITIKSSEYFEAEPVNLNAGIQVKGLTKKFKAKGTDKVHKC